MIEATAAIGFRPIARAITPPGIKLLLGRDKMPHGVDEIRRSLELAELLDFDRRVTHDVKELLVRPDIGLQGRDVEIADEDGRFATVLAAFEPACDLVEKTKLVREFRVFLRIRNIAARRHIEIM